MTTEVKSESAKKQEDWMNSKWRPMMGWLYMGTCTFDFVIFPVLWSLLQSTMGHPVTQWQPLTLQGAGLYHIAMGAVLGLAAFGRTQEKLAGANNGGMQPVAQSVTTTFGAPSAGFGSAPGGFSSPSPGAGFSPAPSWGTTPVAAGGFGAPATGQVVAGFGGKPAPMQPEQPQI
jgi:hypothetical protein